MNSLTYPDTQLQEFDRVRDMSTDKANRSIDASTRESIERATAGGRAAIEQRLVALQQEWDIDRVLMVNFAALVFAQLVAATRDRRWLWGPLVQTPFLMMHATLGWCPPSLWFRPMGFRTRFEIQAEREELLRRLGEPAGLTGSHRVWRKAIRRSEPSSRDRGPRPSWKRRGGSRNSADPCPGSWAASVLGCR